MSRYIDTDNAIERLGAYLMADAQIEYGGLASEDIEDWKPIATDIFKGAPSIDIVFCKECKHNYNTAINHGKMQPRCDFTDYKLTENDYCSRGEREGE